MPLFSPSFLSPRPGGVTDWLAVKVPDHDVDKAGLRAHAEHGFVPVSRVTPKGMEYYRGPVSLSARPTALRNKMGSHSPVAFFLLCFNFFAFLVLLPFIMLLW